MLIFLAALHLMAVVEVHAQESRADTTPLPRERAIQAAYVRRFPCPATVPSAWRGPDGPKASGWRCSMLVASDRALRGHSPSRRFRAADVQCAVVIPMRFTVLGSRRAARDGYWSVEFYQPDGNGARAVIDMTSGRLRAEPLPSEFGYSPDRVCGPAR